MGINPFSLEDEGFSRRNKIQRSAFPRMQLNQPGSRFYVKATRSGRPRKYFREGYSNGADKIKAIVKSSFIRSNRDSTRHIIQHVDYMMKSKIDHDREPDIRKLFNRDGQEITREQGIDMAMRNRGEFAGHKLILSPGVNDIDLVDYARDQMRVLEERLGVRMEYSFAYQKNTDNYHIHVQVPGRGERTADLDSGGRTQKIDIKLDKSDFAAMRAAGDSYIAKHLYLDKETQHIVEHDLLKETFSKEERTKQYQYDRQARKDLGIELSAHDFDVLKELGIEVPGRIPEKNTGMPIKEEQAKQRDLGDTRFAQELTSYLSERETPFIEGWSDRDIGRILDLSDKDPEWVFPNAYKENKKLTQSRYESLEAVRSDERYEHFVKGIDCAMRLQLTEKSMDAMSGGQAKQNWTSDREQIEEFFRSQEGSEIYQKFLETKESTNQTPLNQEALNQTIDEVLQKTSERLETKFDLPKFADDTDADPFTRSEVVLTGLEQREKGQAAYQRMLGFRSSKDFVESFERYVRLEEGRDELPEFQSDNERLAYLAGKLFEPEYSEQREHADLLRQQGFQLYSSFSTRDEYSETKQEVRQHQFELDSKIYELNKDRLQNFNSEYENRDLRTPHSRFDGAADSHSKLYEQSLEQGNEKQVGYSSNKFHQAVMKFDEETLKREDFLYPDNGYEPEDETPILEPEENESEIPDYEIEEDFDKEIRDDMDRDNDVLVNGHSLPLPGFDLDRLDRDPGDDLTHDPTEISVHFTLDDEMRRRREDEEETGNTN